MIRAAGAVAVAEGGEADGRGGMAALAVAALLTIGAAGDDALAQIDDVVNVGVLADAEVEVEGVGALVAALLQEALNAASS